MQLAQYDGGCVLVLGCSGGCMIYMWWLLQLFGGNVFIYNCSGSVTITSSVSFPMLLRQRHAVQMLVGICTSCVECAQLSCFI